MPFKKATTLALLPAKYTVSAMRLPKSHRHKRVSPMEIKTNEDRDERRERLSMKVRTREMVVRTKMRKQTVVASAPGISISEEKPFTLIRKWIQRYTHQEY